jgi:Protein of unknown function (DUF3768)
MATESEQIRALNDRLRQHLNGNDGTAIITVGVAALGDEAVARIFRTIVVYDDFCHENDPYEEHDFGAFEVDGQVIFFKIDLYEEPNVNNPNGEPIVNRVMTIMLAEEY